MIIIDHYSSKLDYEIDYLEQLVLLSQDGYQIGQRLEKIMDAIEKDIESFQGDKPAETDPVKPAEI